MIAGIAGKYSSGKNLAASVFEEHGFLVVDVDGLGHRALESRNREVVERFGESILTPSSRIDRKALGRIVFADREQLLALEAIVHPAMREMVKRIIAENPARSICLNAAILFPMGLHRFCDYVVWVKAPLLRRLRWAMKRDNLSLREVLRRFASQRSLKPQHSSRTVDICTVWNTGDPGLLRARVARIIALKGS